MYQNMMGSPGAPFGGQQVNGMGQQPMPAPRPMPMPTYRGYGFNPQPGGMPQPNPNYGQMPAPAPRPMPMPYPVDFSRLLGGNFTPMPDGGRVDNPYMQHQSRDGGLLYGGPPQPDGGRVDNPDMQNPFRTFNNGNPFYNAKGNLRMRYRPGGQGDMRGQMDAFYQGGGFGQPTGY